MANIIEIINGDGWEILINLDEIVYAQHKKAHPYQSKNGTTITIEYKTCDGMVHGYDSVEESQKQFDKIKKALKNG